ncbi:hypothetical protein BD309DRAFT_961334 [Dichomitus squalens]|nr:hypothetical protein BD309DRAFT_961334 [Dichomitus squalens]
MRHEWRTSLSGTRRERRPPPGGLTIDGAADNSNAPGVMFRRSALQGEYLRWWSMVIIRSRPSVRPATLHQIAPMWAAGAPRKEREQNMGVLRKEWMGEERGLYRLGVGGW